MKRESVAHFNLVKMQNRRVIRNLLREESPLSVAKAASKAGLSYPTASGLLKELAETGEALVSKEQDVAGGRPGICYELNPSYRYALTIYFDDRSLKAVLHDAFGRQVKRYVMENIDSGIGAWEIIDFIRMIQDEYPALSAVAIGIPGAVHGTEIRHLPKFPNLIGSHLADELRTELNVDVYIENDTNAIAFAEVGEWEDFAHIMYVEEDKCIGVGIVLQGEVMKGSNGCAGEMEYLCRNMEDREDTFVTAILALTCVLNLPDILISGEFCTEGNVRKIREKLCDRLPEDRLPEIHVIDDMTGLYVRGLLRRILAAWSEQM